MHAGPDGLGSKDAGREHDNLTPTDWRADSINNLMFHMEHIDIEDREMPGGRPRKYKTPELMQAKIDAYFARCKSEDEPLTITGLALALGQTRTELLDYAQRGEFASTVKMAKARVENDYEIAARRNGRAGDIFGLKNFGWSDRYEQTTTLTGNLTISWDTPAPTGKPVKPVKAE